MKLEYFKQENDYITRREIDTDSEDYIKHDADFVWVYYYYDDEYYEQRRGESKYHRFFFDLKNEMIKDCRERINRLQEEIDIYERCHHFEHYWEMKCNSKKNG